MLSLAEWLLFAATGRVLIFLWFMFPLPPVFENDSTKYIIQFINKLHSCDLCAGTWIYAFLAVMTGADMSGTGSIITMLATGAVTSFLVHVFMIGVREKFSPPVII